MEQTDQTAKNKPVVRARLPRPVRERQMIEAATRAFGSYGFHGASMEEISVEVGVSKPMIYAYFDSKEKLYLTCIRHAGIELINAVRDSFDPNVETEEQLGNGFRAFLMFIADNGEAWALIRNETLAGTPMFPEEIEKVRVLLRDVVRQLITQSSLNSQVDREKLDAAALAMAYALLGATEAMGNWWNDNRATVAVEVPVSYLMTIFWNGVEQLWAGGDWYPEQSPAQSLSPPDVADEIQNLAQPDAAGETLAI